MQQTITRPQTGVRRPRSQQALLIAAIFISFAGLASGFTFGALVHHGKQQNDFKDKVVSHAITPTVSPTPPPGPRPLGCPIVRTNQIQQQADDSTQYTANVQAEEKYQGQTCNLEGKQKALQEKGITCRLWLMKGSRDPLKLPTERIKKMQLDDPFPDDAEVVDGLKFIGVSGQSQVCEHGLGTWKYTVSSTVESGTYYLMGLTIWEGRYYNWSWTRVTIKNAKLPVTKDPEQNKTATATPNNQGGSPQ